MWVDSVIKFHFFHKKKWRSKINFRKYVTIKKKRKKNLISDSDDTYPAHSFKFIT